MSGSHAYGGDPAGMAGAYHYGTGSIGTLGSDIPTDSFIYPSLSLPADAAKEYYGLITSIPAGLTIVTMEPGDYDASANDGTYTVPFDLYEWGVKLTPSASFALTFGGATVSLTGANSTGGAASGTGAISVTPAVAGTVNLSGAGARSTAVSGVGVIQVFPVGSIPYVSPARTVNFGGGTNRVDFDGGTNRVDF